jgi:uncharacterized Zn finger protein
MARKVPIRDRFAPISESQIKNRTDSGSFSRGRAYFRSGHIIAPALRAGRLMAQCLGSELEPYRVSATLAPAGQKGTNPLDFGCSCPRGGFCKHVVALLLTWIDAPERFVERPPLASQLAEHSREDLMAMIERMVDRHPDLQRLVDFPVLAVPDVEAGASASETTVDADAIRRHIRTVFADVGHATAWDYADWGVAPHIVSEIEPLVEFGQQLGAAGQWVNAQIVFTAIAEELIEEIDEAHLAGDEESELAGIIFRVVGALAEMLDIQQHLSEEERLPGDARERLIRTIHDLWVYDAVGGGGIDTAAVCANALIRATTPEERAMVEAWLRAETTTASRPVRAVTGLIASMRSQDGATLEDLLTLYHDAELWEEVAIINLELGRIDEAATVAGRHLRNAYALRHVADRFVEHGGEAASRGIALVDDLLWEIEGTDRPAEEVLEGWLMERYRQLARPDRALEMAQRRFQRNPSLETFRDVRRIAEMPGVADGTWEKVRPALFDRVKGAELLPALVEILLSERDVAGALHAYEQLGRQQPGASRYVNPVHWVGQLGPQVAEAAAETHPDQAVAIWLDLAERRIDQRKRDTYQQAAAYLARVKAVLEGSGRTEEWRTVITELRGRHTRLRALREELDALELR